jgi:intermembrane space import and assembly protein 40
VIEQKRKEISARLERSPRDKKAQQQEQGQQQEQQQEPAKKTESQQQKSSSSEETAASQEASQSPSTVAVQGSPEALEEEAGQQGAFNPETGEINWDCPCLGGMAHGPCGEEFKTAFSCFVYSDQEPKGMDCIEKFQYVTTHSVSSFVRFATGISHHNHVWWDGRGGKKK